jgi:hypothetical protein
MPVILATQEGEIRKISVQSQPRQKVRPYLKNAQHTKKRASGVAQVVNHLPSKCEAQSSNPVISKTNKQKTYKGKHEAKGTQRREVLFGTLHQCRMSKLEVRLRDTPGSGEV